MHIVRHPVMMTIVEIGLRRIPMTTPPGVNKLKYSMIRGMLTIPALIEMQLRSTVPRINLFSQRRHNGVGVCVMRMGLILLQMADEVGRPIRMIAATTAYDNWNPRL